MPFRAMFGELMHVFVESQCEENLRMAVIWLSA